MQDRKIAEKEIFLHQEKFTGQNWQKKLENLYSKINPNSDAVFISAAESCSYLFNIRSFIIDYVPTCPSYALIGQNKEILLFLDDKNLNKKAKESLKGINITNFDNLSDKIANFCSKNKIKNLEIDLNQCNYDILDILEQNKLNLIDKIDPTLLQKAVKNQT